MNADGTGQTNISNNAGFDYGPSWQSIQDSPVTPGQAANNLITLANSYGTNTNVLGNAVTLLNDNNPNNDSGACGKLDAFINQVNANNSLSSAEKTQLILDANAIKTSLGC